MIYALSLLGLVLIFAGGEFLIRGGVGLSRLFGLSPLLIGLVVISVGTSAPELAVTLQAVFEGHPGVGIGNIVGSNITNILLVLGVGALIRPIPTAPKIVFRDDAVLFFASVALLIVSWNGMIGGGDSVVLLLGLLLFLVLSFVLDQRRPDLFSLFVNRLARREQGIPHPAVSLVFLVLGGLFLYFGSELLVNGAVALAHAFGISDTLIGLTLIAIGTSLPELATTVVAGIRGETGLAIGNLIGSNIFNILGVVGLSSAFHPIRVSAQTVHEDMMVMLAVVVLILPMLKSGWRVSRIEGLILLLCYAGYGVFLGIRAGLIAPSALGLG